MRRHPHPLTIAMLTAFVVAAVAAQTADISGTWSFSVDVGEVHTDPVFTFTQKGETLTGTISRPNGTQKVTGTVRDGSAVFGFEAVRDGAPFKAVYTGTIESASRMTGTVEFSGALAGVGTWTATKK
jgi:hypothetical protein